MIAAVAVVTVGVIAAAVTVIVVVSTRSSPRRSAASAPASSASTRSVVSATATTIPSDATTPTSPAPPALPSTSTPMDLTAVASSPRLPAVASTLDTYFTGINAHDPQKAASAFAPGGSINPNDAQAVRAFGHAISTTTDDQIVVRSIRPAPVNGTSGIVVQVAFRSQQDPSLGPQGESCTNWSLDYDMVPRGSAGYGLLKAKNVNNRAC